MAKQKLRFKDFGGGISDDSKLGPKNSASSATSVDFRRSAAQAGLLRKPAKESGSAITTEVCDAVCINSGDVYMAGLSRLYKRAVSSNGAAGTYSTATSSLNGATCRDIDYRPDLNALFLYSAQEIHEYGNLLNSPTIATSKYTAYYQDVQTTTGGAYVLPTSLTEADKIPFTVSAEPITSAAVYMAAKGAGTVTAVLHDNANNLLATNTFSNATVPAALAEFTFTITGSGSPSGRLKLGNSYHIHLYSSAVGMSVRSDATNTAAKVSTRLYIQRMVDTGETGHRTLQSGAMTYFCNERYLGQWEILDTTANSISGYDAHRLVFLANYVSNGLAEYSEYLAISCAIKQGSDSLDSKGSSGAIVFWDKTSEFHQFVVPVPQGVPNGLFSYGNALYFEARGTCYMWAGGEIETVYQFPDVDEFQAGGIDSPQIDAYLRAARNSMTSWKTLLLIAFPYLTANTLVEYGVYSYGKQKSFMPKAVGQDYLLSTGHSDVQFDTSTTPDTPITGFTCLKSFGSNLFIAWKDRVGGATTYGVDYLNELSGFATDAVWRSLWFDNGDPDVLKTPIAIKITFEPLEAGCTVTPVIEYDRSGTELTGTAATAGMVDIVFSLETSDRFYEAMVGYNVTGSGTDDVRINSINFEFDDNRENSQSTKDRRATD